jgi:hypothetical protein
MTAHAILDLDREPLDALPADDPPDWSVLDLSELLLKAPDRVDRLNREEAGQTLPLLTRFLLIAQLSYLLYGLAMAVILNAAPAAAYPSAPLAVPAVDSFRGSAGLVLAYCVGLVTTTCICLPSFYFFALLAGVRMSFLQVAGQVVRCKASSALALVGILPIYVALVLGLVVFGAPTELLRLGLYLGLALPFVAGLAGVRAIYRGVMGMADTLPDECRARRGCFLRRLTVSWAVCYTAVAPVMIYRLWEWFAG